MGYLIGWSLWTGAGVGKVVLHLLHLFLSMHEHGIIVSFSAGQESILSHPRLKVSCAYPYCYTIGVAGVVFL